MHTAKRGSANGQTANHWPAEAWPLLLTLFFLVVQELFWCGTANPWPALPQTAIPWPADHFAIARVLFLVQQLSVNLY